MTRPRFYQYAVGSVQGLPLGSLTYVEDITAGGVQCYPPQGFGGYRAGLEAWRGNGVGNYQGFESTDWKWTGQGGNGYITYAQANALRSAIGNVWSGTVTVYTKTTSNTSYALYDGVMTIYQIADSGANFKSFNRFGVRLTHLVAR